MEKERIQEMITECEFSHHGFFRPADLNFMPEVRKMCEDNKCHQYNKSWSCPPACGTLEEVTQKALAFENGVLVQTTFEMEDDFDVEAMLGAESMQKKRFQQLVKLFRKAEIACLPMGAGACTLCQECTYPDKPCRFPNETYPSMEAYGLMVSDVCKSADTKYYYGPLTITYTSCILF